MKQRSGTRADSQWSREVRKRDHYLCRYALPGCTRRATESDHIYTRKYKATRLLTLNGLAVCRGCHAMVTRDVKLKWRLIPHILSAEDLARLNRIIEDNYGKAAVRT